MADTQELGALAQFDLKLLAALEADGRLTNPELGEKIGLSASQCSRRRIRLEGSGIIERYHARLNSARLGSLRPGQLIPAFEGKCKIFSRFSEWN